MRNTNEEDRYSNESNTKSQDKDTMVNKESNTKSRDKDTMEISKIEIDRNELNNSKRVKRSMLPKKTLKYQIIVIF